MQRTCIMIFELQNYLFAKVMDVKPGMGPARAFRFPAGSADPIPGSHTRSTGLP